MAISNKESIIFDFYTPRMLPNYNFSAHTGQRSLNECLERILLCGFSDGIVLNNDVVKSNLFKELYDIKN